MLSVFSLKFLVMVLTGFSLAIGFALGNRTVSLVETKTTTAIASVKARRFNARHLKDQEVKPEWAQPGPSFFEKLSNPTHTQVAHPAVA